ncbi:hypothetical protein B9N62_01490 [Campylobacter concisus]|uniref:Uncharacterized protein n=1 Tax=Campylobacter concisus TaxID=199 RepID=A0A1Y5MVY7_9BACT|nr:hypothetical protein [Campylobacter concisus]OUT12479.1 hypothetical protein B9N62_01490 [Campylobacter concisus]
MKIINKIIFLWLMVFVSPALFAEQTAEKCFNGFLDNKAHFAKQDKFDDFDFSNILADKRIKFLGYIGANYHRLHINFDSIKKISRSKYVVSGNYKITEEARPFNGEIQISEIRKYTNFNYGVDDFMKGKINAQGIALATYLIKGETEKFQAKGCMLTRWYIDNDEKLLYNDISEDEDLYANNLFCGECKVDKVQIKPCAWDHCRIPNSGDLDIGAGEFSPNPKYIGNDWSDFNKDE